VCVNAIMPGVFVTDLNRKLLEGTARGQEFLLRTPMGRFGELEELVGPAVYLASGLITGEILRVDCGMIASGVNEVPSRPCALAIDTSVRAYSHLGLLSS